MALRNDTPPFRRYGMVFLFLATFAFFLGFIFLNNIESRDIPSKVEDVAVSRLITSTTTPQVEKAKTTIVAFGDSVTAGYGITIPEAYPKQLENFLRARGLDVTVINSGVSGETTAGGLRRAHFVADQKPDIALVALGGNDVLRGIPPGNTKENLAQIITIFQKAGMHVVLVGMYAPANLGDAYVREFNAIYPDLARTYAVPLVPFLLDGVALDPALNQDDGIHPNQRGAKIIAEQNILPILLPLLRH